MNRHTDPDAISKLFQFTNGATFDSYDRNMGMTKSSFTGPKSFEPRKVTSKLVFALSLFFFVLWALPAFAGPPSHPLSYRRRPVIESVNPHALARSLQPRYWGQTRRAFLRVLAQLLAFYPQDHMFLLGRDGEYLYDLARILLRQHPEVLVRFHLINVSRKGSKSPLLKRYLRQEGMNSQVIGEARAIVFDTGIFGTVLFRMKKAAPVKASIIRGHFMEFQDDDSGMMMPDYGQQPKIPMSRIAMEAYTPELMSGLSINCLESIPHYTKTATQLVENDGIIEPISEAPQKDVEQRMAVALMQDIRAFAESPETVAEFNALWNSMDQLTRIATGQAALDSIAIAEALTVLDRYEIDSFFPDLNDAVRKKNILVPASKLNALRAFIPANISWDSFPTPDGNRSLDDVARTLPLRLAHLRPFLNASGSEAFSALGPDDRHIVEALLNLRKTELSDRIIKYVLRRHDEYALDIDLIIELLWHDELLKPVFFHLLAPKISHWVAHPRAQELFRALIYYDEYAEGTDLSYRDNIARRLADAPEWDSNPAMKSFLEQYISTRDDDPFKSMRQYFDEEVVKSVIPCSSWLTGEEHLLTKK